MVTFFDDPTVTAKIGKNFPELVRAQLFACLRENTYLFAWSATDMHKIDADVACHQLNIDPSVSVVA